MAFHDLRCLFCVLEVLCLFCNNVRLCVLCCAFGSTTGFPRQVTDSFHSIHEFRLFFNTMVTRRVAVAMSSTFVVVLLLLVGLLSVLGYYSGSMGSTSPRLGANDTLIKTHRKLLRRAVAVEEPNRIWGEKCTKSDIVINQGPTGPLPSGIPTYTVEIMNVCVTGCDIYGIHLNCGWFSSAHLINPKIFKRLRYDDCLVNDGKPLMNGGTLSFQYANTFLYPLCFLGPCWDLADSEFSTLVPQTPPLVTALFVIGDSSIDCGTNNYLGTLARADRLPYGRDFDTHRPTGRFCDGRIPVDYLGLWLNRKSFVVMPYSLHQSEAQHQPSPHHHHHAGADQIQAFPYHAKARRPQQWLNRTSVYKQ
ncbi:hypothetical protein FNV43_RR21231 [Rhamnella rubrinervis]|uniref:Uncharacterized protein n=1 Tax=Rhamnella rubrinervis TaxID=2594499 RepID=A0A8K0E2Q9_9ROSA|nr:hypothetical protein FNV43_RR21231 [Rhamnella rubrinervis]